VAAELAGTEGTIGDDGYSGAGGEF